MAEILMTKRRCAANGCKLVSKHRKLILAVATALTATSSAAMAQSGTWINAAGGTWTDTLNWDSGVIADGDNTAVFNTPTLDPLADVIVTLGADRTIAHLNFGDSDPLTAASWTVAAGNILTLAGTAPSINVGALGTGKSVILAAQVNNTTSIIKSGAGIVTFTNALNAITGSIAINGGRLNAGTNGNFTNGGIGTGAITLSGGGTLGTANMTAAGNTWSLGATNTIFVPAGETGTVAPQGRATFGGAISSGAGAVLNMNVGSTQSRHDLQSSWAGFQGTLNVTGTVGGNNMRLISTSGYVANGMANTAVNLFGTAGLNPSHTGSGAATYVFGSLASSSATTSVFATNAGTGDTVSVGGLNMSTTFAGNITGNLIVQKTGSGILTLSGATNTYTRATQVNGGTLNFMGTKSQAVVTDAIGDVTVNTGANLGGTGVLNGTTIIASGGRISPGAASVSDVATPFTVGTLNVNALTLNIGSQLSFDFGSGVNDVINVGTLATPGAGTITINGGALSLFNETTGSLFNTNGSYNLIQATTIAGTGLGALSIAPAANDPAKLYTFGNSGGFITLTIATNPNAPIYWNLDGDGTWNTGANWVGGVAPNGASKTASLGGGGTAITAPRTVSISSNQTVGTLLINNAANAFTVASSGGSLVLDNGGVAANVTLLAGSHSITAPVVVSAGGATFTVADASKTLTLSGGISGSAGVNYAGPGTTILSGSQTYSGTTTLQSGTLRLAGGTNTLPVANALAIAGGTLDLNGNAQTVSGALSGVGTITNGGATNSVLTVGGGGTFSGPISNGATNTVALVKNGANTLDLSGGARTYTGGTTINGGTIAITNAAGLGTGPIAINTGGALTVTGAANLANALTFSGNTTLNGEGAGTYTDSGPISGTGSLTLASTAAPKSWDITSTANTFSGSMTLAGNITIRFNNAGAVNGNIALSTGAIAGGTYGSNITADTTFAIGSLAGSASTILRGHTSSGGGAITTWQIGALNASTTFSGAVVDGNSGTVDRPTVISKVGSGTQTFGGDVDTYTGATNVNAGTLVIDNDYTPTQQGTVVVGATPSTVLTIASGATATITTGHTALFYDVSNSGTLNVAGTLGYQTADGVVKSISQLTPGGGLLSSRGRLNVANTVTSVGALSATENGIVALQGGLKVTSLDAGSGRVFLSTSSTAPLVVDYTGGSSLPTVQGYILSGHGTTLLGGLYDYVSLSGLSSETLGATNASAGFNKYAIAAIDNTDVDTYNAIPGGASYGTFGGVGVDASSVLIRYTYAGDANLDGVISSLDYALINAGFAGTIPASKGWIAGDFNFDGAIDASDYAIIDFGYLTGGNVPLAFGDPISVPEPGSLSLLGLGAAAIMGRRRRN